jgi:hypothetical protein
VAYCPKAIEVGIDGPLAQSAGKSTTRSFMEELGVAIKMHTRLLAAKGFCPCYAISS